MPLTHSVPDLVSDQCSHRADQLFHSYQHDIAKRTDRLFAGLMLLQWIGAICAAFWLSPRTWAGAHSETHLHVWAAILMGGLTTLLPVMLAICRPGSVLTRHIIAISQMLTSALLIHLCGGRIETHFHVFGSLAFLACYRDWRVLLTATGVIAADHLIRGVFYPQSVFGVLTISPIRVFEHAAWVVFEDIFLIVAILQSVAEMKTVSQQRAHLEITNEYVEAEVQSRTKQLEQAMEFAQASNVAKSEFLANMSHEIRTPMTAMLGFTDILLTNVTDSESIDAARTVKENGNYLLSLINDILDLSKIESGRFEITNQACSPREIVAEVIALMEVPAKAKSLPLELCWDGPIPDQIATDPVRLRQILINLTGNAIKFTEAGLVQLIVRLERDSNQPPSLRFDVIDTGIGIAKSKQNEIFQPFTQADGSMTRTFGGTGLGLSISKRLVQLLGGEISLSSEIGQGSTFSFCIPTGPLECTSLTESSEDQQPMIPSDTATGRQPQAANLESLLAGCQILLTEDGADNQRLISFILRKAGAEVTIAENGKIGWKLANEAVASGQPFDVILMDMQMPVLDGYAATRRLRGEGYRGPIIALTAHAMARDRQQCIEAGCDDYASKPIDRQALVQLVASYADRQTANQLLSQAH